MKPVTITLGPPPPNPSCRYCGEPAIVEVRHALQRGPGDAERELLQVFPLLLCRSCYPDRIASYLRRVPRRFGASLEIIAVSLDVVVKDSVPATNPWTGFNLPPLPPLTRSP